MKSTLRFAPWILALALAACSPPEGGEEGAPDQAEPEAEATSPTDSPGGKAPAGQAPAEDAAKGAAGGDAAEASAPEASEDGGAPPAPTTGGNPIVTLSTSQGDIEIELFREKAPESVANFLTYVESGYYDGTVFHRVIEDFMIQGGGFTLEEGGAIRQKPTNPPIQNEAKNGLQNARGTVAMARTGDPHSATAQFFINHKDNDSLDYPSFDGWGYAVFGEVVGGMDVVDSIAALPTTTSELETKVGPRSMQDVPAEPVVIQSVSVK